MEIKDTSIPAVKLIRPVRHGDHRGFFSEVYVERALSAAGVEIVFTQDNHSRSAEKGVLRGLHFQTPPFAQAKLLRVIRGSIFDVAVDIRHGSPTFGQHVSAILSAENWEQLLVPEGFAHGFCTLEPDTEVLYKVNAYYAPANDGGIAWDDPALGIAWPLDGAPITSAKDGAHPRLADLPAYFTYQG